METSHWLIANLTVLPDQGLRELIRAAEHDFSRLDPMNDGRARALLRNARDAADAVLKAREGRRC